MNRDVQNSDDLLSINFRVSTVLNKVLLLQGLKLLVFHELNVALLQFAFVCRKLVVAVERDVSLHVTLVLLFSAKFACPTLRYSLLLWGSSEAMTLHRMCHTLFVYYRDSVVCFYTIVFLSVHRGS